MPQPVRVVVVTAFEPDSGSVPGEARAFLDGLGLHCRLALVAAYRDVWASEDGSLLLIVTGVGAAQAAVSVMALGLDPRFDLSAAYWLVSGVAGTAPEQASLGSVVLPAFVVDGDLTHEIDARELPPGWPDGFVPIGKAMPYEEPCAQRFNGEDGIVFRLDEALVAWAFGLARGVPLLDSEAMAARRIQFEPLGKAHLPPSVERGDELASTTFWHGRALSERATRWVAYQTGGVGRYAISAMEDAGICTALMRLDRAGRVRFDRVLIVRASSNYDRQRTGVSAAESLAETRVASYSAYRPALENAWRVGRVLIAAWLAGEREEF